MFVQVLPVDTVHKYIPKGHDRLHAYIIAPRHPILWHSAIFNCLLHPMI